MRSLDALANDVEEELVRLGDDSDLATVSGFFQATVSVAPPSLLTPAQVEGTSELPRGVVQWSPEGGWLPVDGATPPSPYDVQVIGNPVDPNAELRIDWNAGAPTEEITVGTMTVELPTDASAVVLAGEEEIADATFVADWALVDEVRCGASEPSLTATSLALDVAVGGHALAFDASTTADATTLSVEATAGVLRAELDFTIDEQVRILAEPCPSELPLGGFIGTPTRAALGVGVDSPDHAATLSVEASEARWETVADVPTLTAFELTGTLSVDGSQAVAVDGSYDASAEPPFTIVVRFDDRAMTVEEIVQEVTNLGP